MRALQFDGSCSPLHTQKPSTLPWIVAFLHFGVFDQVNLHHYDLITFGNMDACGWQAEHISEPTIIKTTGQHQLEEERDPCSKDDSRAPRLKYSPPSHPA